MSALILNKLDVKAFAMLRDTLGKKVYEVRARGNAGTINGVPYIINSNCEAIKDPATTTGTVRDGIRSALSNYMMTIFLRHGDCPLYRFPFQDRHDRPSRRDLRWRQRNREKRIPTRKTHLRRGDIWPE